LWNPPKRIAFNLSRKAHPHTVHFSCPSESEETQWRRLVRVLRRKPICRRAENRSVEWGAEHLRQPLGSGQRRDWLRQAGREQLSGCGVSDMMDPALMLHPLV